MYIHVCEDLSQQCFYYSRCIGLVTPNFFYLHYIYFFTGSKYPKSILFNFGNRSTAAYPCIMWTVYAHCKRWMNFQQLFEPQSTSIVRMIRVFCCILTINTFWGNLTHTSAKLCLQIEVFHVLWVKCTRTLYPLFFNFADVSVRSPRKPFVLSHKIIFIGSKYP